MRKQCEHFLASRRRALYHLVPASTLHSTIRQSVRRASGDGKLSVVAFGRLHSTNALVLGIVRRHFLHLRAGGAQEADGPEVGRDADTRVGTFPKRTRPGRSHTQLAQVVTPALSQANAFRPRPTLLSRSPMLLAVPLLVRRTYFVHFRPATPAVPPPPRSARTVYPLARRVSVSASPAACTISPLLLRLP